MHTCAVGYYIFCTDASSGGSSAKRPQHRAGALERRRVKSRGEGEEVPSLEKKVEGWTYVVKAEGPGPRGVAGERPWATPTPGQTSPAVDAGRLSALAEAEKGLGVLCETAQ